jgi:hypothetical protein
MQDDAVDFVCHLADTAGKKLLAQDLKALSERMKMLSRNMQNLYGQEHQHAHELRGAAHIAETWAQAIIKEVQDAEQR